MPYPIHVAGISPATSIQSLKDFFAFCGSITSVDYKEKSGNAEVTFEKPQAARTALMLSGGALDGSVLTITSDITLEDEPTAPHHDGHPIDQSDKPRAGIAAEYLAKGYALSDSVLQRAIEIDNQQGISKRFLNYFQAIDKSIGERALGKDQTVTGKLQSTVDQAATQARSLDEQKGYSKLAHEYYVKAISSPLGQKVRQFYTDTSKAVTDIHEEARRIANEHKETPHPEATGSETPSAPTSN